MLYDASEYGHTVEVVDVNGNLNERLTPHTDVTLWNGEGGGQMFDGLIEVDAPHLKFIGRADELLRKYGFLVLLNGKNLAACSIAA